MTTFGPQSDNPTSHILNNILGVGRSTTSFADKLDMLGYTGGPKDFWKTLQYDKYNAATRLGEMEAFHGSGGAGRLFTELKKRRLLGGDVSRSTFEKLGQGGDLYFSRKSQALFFRSGAEFSPLPLQVGPGLVSRGFSRRTANMFQQLGRADSWDPSGDRTRTYTEGFYEALHKNIAGRNLDSIDLHKIIRNKVSKTKLAMIGYQGGEKITTGPALESLLGGNEYARGRRISGSAQTTGLKAKLVEFAGTTDPFFERARKFRLALHAEAAITKTSGRYIPREFSAALGRTVSVGEAFGHIEKWKNEFFEEVPKAFERLGVAGLHALTKGEYLIDPDNMVFPTPLAGKVIGDAIINDFRTKGRTQDYKMQGVTKAHAKRMVDMGGRPIASFMTREQYKYLAQTGSVFHGGPRRVAVLDFESELYSKLFTQEGGSMLTPFGASYQATEHTIGTIKLQGVSSSTIKNLESVFRNEFSVGLGTQHPGSSIDFNENDIKTVLAAKTEADIKRLKPKHKALHSLVMERRKTGGVWKSVARPGHGVWRAVAKLGGNLGTLSMTDSGITMSFMSSEPMSPRSVETVTGSRRFTSFAVAKTHRLSKVLKELGLRGIHEAISVEEILKMGPTAFMEQFYSSLERSGELNRLPDILGPAYKGFRHVRVPGVKARIPVAMVTDEATAYARAVQAVKGWQEGSDTKLQKLATEIQHGTSVALSGMKLAGTGIRGIRVFSIGGSVRSDFQMDINIMKPVKITPGKIRMMAMGSAAMGYSTPMDDPLFRVLTSRGSWGKGGVKMDPATMDMVLSEKNAFRQYTRTLMGAEAGLNPNQTIKVTRDGLYRQTKSGGSLKLKALPDYAKFAHGEAGVTFADLSDTIFDRRFTQRMMAIDLGAPVTMEVMGKQVSTRYLPVPLSFARTRRGPNGRLVLSSGHPAEHFTKAFNILEANPDILLNPNDPKNQAAYQKFMGLMSKGHNKILGDFRGKKGLFDRLNTVVIKDATAVRLVPQMSNLYKAGDLTSVFDVGISESDIDDFLLRKYGTTLKEAKAQKGGAAKKFVDALTGGHARVALGADPMQSPEHMIIAKLRMQSAVKGSKVGEMNLAIHPLLHRLFRRDTDKDRITMILLDALDNTGKLGTGFDDRIARQTEKLKTFALWDQYQSARKSVGAGSPLIDFMKDTAMKASDMVRAFTGQKVSAHGGYSIMRAVDRFMPALISLGEDARSFVRGMPDVSSEFLSAIRAPYLNDPARMSHAYTVAHNIFQGGVQKGSETSKASLDKLKRDLVMLGQRYKEGGVASLNYDEIVEKSSSLFDEFLRTTKYHTGVSTDYVLDLAARSMNISKVSLDAMKADLKRGMEAGLSQAEQTRIAGVAEKLDSMMVSGMSRLLGEFIGVGHVVGAMAKRSTRTLMSMIEDRAFDTSDESAWATASMFAGSDVPKPASGAGRMRKAVGRATSAEASSTQKMSKAIAKFLGEASAGKAFYVGGAVGVLGYAMTVGGGMTIPPNEAPLPPPVDVTQPYDRGPAVPPLSRDAKVYGYGGSVSPRPSRARAASIRGQNFDNGGSYQRSNFSIKDYRDPVSPHMIERRMKSVSESDYVR